MLRQRAVAVRENETRWQLRADCRDADGDWDLNPEAALTDANREAVAVCEGCAVRATCLEFALATEGAWPRYNIWGGATPADRERIARARQRRAY